jgi:hypothetical protein
MSDELQDSFNRAQLALDLMKMKTRIAELKARRIRGQTLTPEELKELGALETRVAEDAG